MPLLLEDALRALAPFASALRFDAEGTRQMLVSHASRADLVRVVGDAMTQGRLTSASWREITDCNAPDDFIAAFGSLWDRLVATRLAEDLDGFPETWTHETLRLWAYTREWRITSEDEDLSLMDEAYVPGLLHIAAEPACPKRDFIFDVVHHWARDTASSAVQHESFPNVVTSLAQHVTLAREANDEHLANYLLRLGSYAVPTPVDRASAHQRGLDLTGCHEPTREEVTVELEGDDWRVEIPAPFPKTIRVSRTDGRIR